MPLRGRRLLVEKQHLQRFALLTQLDAFPAQYCPLSHVSPRSCCIVLFTLQKACYTHSVCLSPAKRLFIVVNVVFVVFHPQQAHRERARRREVVPIVWRISFSRRRGRVARGKPQGFALPLYAGRMAGSASDAAWAAADVATSRLLLFVGP